MIITQALTAGRWYEYNEEGDFFRILTDSASGSFDVKFYEHGREVVEAEAVRPGYSERFIGSKFTSLRIRSAVGGTVQFVVRRGNVVGYDVAPTGAVKVEGYQNTGNFVQSPVTVTNANSTLRGANPARKYLLIQNKDSVGTIYVMLQDSIATISPGITLGPGDSLELASIVPTNIIRAIGDIASNPNVLVVEAS